MNRERYDCSNMSIAQEERGKVVTSNSDGYGWCRVKRIQDTTSVDGMTTHIWAFGPVELKPYYLLASINKDSGLLSITRTSAQRPSWN
jgi:hypothetical protein